jgi:hypothetical protein
MVLPGSRYAVLDGVDHVGLVLPHSWIRALTGVKSRYPRFAADAAEAIVRWVHRRRTP